MDERIENARWKLKTVRLALKGFLVGDMTDKEDLTDTVVIVEQIEDDLQAVIQEASSARKKSTSEGDNPDLC